MVVSAERALLLITAVGATTISASYDAAKLNAYFAAKPGALAARAAELAAGLERQLFPLLESLRALQGALEKAGPR